MNARRQSAALKYRTLISFIGAKSNILDRPKNGAGRFLTRTARNASLEQKNRGHMAMFLAVAELAEALAGEASRLKKRAAIAEAILRAHEDAPESGDAGLFAMYVAGTPFAEADSRKLNAGGALLTKALLAVSGATSAELTAAYKRHGDLGEAFAGMALVRITAVRAGLVEGLLRRATALEAKYLLKLMIGDMRIGVKQSLVEEAIAVAASKPTSESPDVGHPVLHPNEQRRSLGAPVGVAEV